MTRQGSVLETGVGGDRGRFSVSFSDPCLLFLSANDWNGGRSFCSISADNIAGDWNGGRSFRSILFRLSSTGTGDSPRSTPSVCDREPSHCHHLCSNSYSTYANRRLSGAQEFTLMEPWPPKKSRIFRRPVPSAFISHKDTSMFGRCWLGSSPSLL